MPIWSLTAERLARLKDAIAKRKAEHDELLALSEKELWCRDLDDFSEVWENQMKLQNEIRKDIRRRGRRVSKKIGAGKTRKAKDDDDYEPEKKSKAKTKTKAAPVKTETKTAQRFAEMFSTKPKKETKVEELADASDGFSDDDFAALSRSKPVVKPSPSEEPELPRNKRAAASKAKTLFGLDSDSDEDEAQMLGDVGNLVKGIGKTSGDSSGRLSLHAMHRPESSHDRSSSGGLSRAKSKPSKTFDLDSADETNYEMLAKSSPFKTAPKGGDDIDSFLSDDEPAPSKPAAKASAAAMPGAAEVKKRGRPAGAKNKAKDEPAAKPKAKAKPAPKQTTLSPAAKAYAAKKAGKKSVVDESDEDMADPESSPPRPAARSRRAAAARKPIVIDEDSSMAVDDDSDDPFDMDDD